MNDQLEPISEPGPDLGDVPPAAAVNDSFLGRLIDLIIKPARLMENVGRAPRWWQAGLLIFVIIVGFSWLTLPISAPEQIELMRDSRLTQLAPPEVMEQAYQQALDPSPAKRILDSLKAGISSWVMVMVMSLVLGFFARMSGGVGRMKQSLGIVHWASIIPLGLGALIKLPLVLATESVMSVNLGLAALLPDPDPGSALFQILMQFGDFGAWWGLFVVIVGFRVVHRMTGAMATVAAVLPWALLAAIPTIIAILMM